MGGDDHDGGAVCAQRRRRSLDRRRQRGDAQATGVGGGRRRQRARGHDPHEAHPHSGRRHHRRRPDVRPRDGLARGGVDQVRRQERKRRLCRPRLQRTARIVGRLLRCRRRPDRTEVELVIADRRSRVSQRVEGGHHGRAFIEVGFERPLEHVAGVDEQRPPRRLWRARPAGSQRSRRAGRDRPDPAVAEFRRAGRWCRRSTG